MTIKNVIIGVLIFYPMISTNIPSRLVPKLLQHTPGHRVCRRPIYGGRYLCIISKSGIIVFTGWSKSEDNDGDPRWIGTIAANANVDARRAPGVRVREDGRRGGSSEPWEVQAPCLSSLLSSSTSMSTNFPCSFLWSLHDKGGQTRRGGEAR